MPTVQIGSETIFYVQRGQEDHLPLVFIHGAGAQHAIWGYQLNNLKRAYRVALDLPGHGQSTGPGRITIEGYAEAVVAFLDALHLRNVVVVGHSMGGAIAQTLALTAPERMRGLVLIGTGARLRVLSSLLEGLRTDFLLTSRHLVSLAYAPSTPASLIRRGLTQWAQNRPQAVVRDFLACHRFDVTDRLREIRCPTLVLCGDEDMLTPPKLSRYLGEHIPHAEVHIIPAAGHMVMIEQPEETTRAIQSFVDRLIR